MTHRIHLVLALIGIVLLTIAPSAQAISAPAAADTAPELIPLPGGCIGGLPDGGDPQACCMFGYVFVDGQAVEGARVKITSSHGSKEVVTANGPHSSQPYYGILLNKSPLDAQV